MKKVTKIEKKQHAAIKKKKLRVAAYCRVSTDSDDQHESLETQKTHYESYIASRDDWQFAGIYCDEGISGTGKARRPQLARMLADCKAGKIDFIVTKSISRFSRNTVDCLELVRKLLDLDIPVWFEKENINTGLMESELFLSILSSMAADESRSISLNNKWGIKKRFANGTYKIISPPYGYDWDGEKMVINPAQAKVVKRIFAEVLTGKGSYAIAKELNRENISTKRGRRWSSTGVGNLIANEKLCGDCLFQKTFSDASYKRHLNHGEQEQYLFRDHHEAIVSREDWNAAQAMIAQHASERNIRNPHPNYQKRYAFSGKIVCGYCGATFKRRTHYASYGNYISWCCQTHLYHKSKCPMLFVRDDDLKRAFCTMMNKLIFAHKLILKPYLDALKKDADTLSKKQVRQMQTRLTQNKEKRETLTRLTAQGIIDSALFDRETAALLKQADEISKEIETLKGSASGEATSLTSAKDLLRFAEKSEMLGDFDPELFNRFVLRIVIRSRQEASFELKCGLVLKERLN